MDKYPNINMVGVELEGGWVRDSDYLDEMKGDGSVNVNGSDYDPDEDDDENYSGTYKNGEIVSPPISEWEKLSDFMKSRYPDKVNDTCGLHVHVSTNTIGQYQALADERFYKFIKFSLANWGKKANIRRSHRFWSRLQGRNSYCEDFFDPDSQMAYAGSNRYCIVNYCFSLHGTMEVRVLPMFIKPSVSISAVNHVLWTVNKYLSLPSCLKQEAIVKEYLIEAEIEPAMLDSINVNID